jgi:hypothetical protein
MRNLKAQIFALVVIASVLAPCAFAEEIEGGGGVSEPEGDSQSAQETSGTEQSSEEAIGDQPSDSGDTERVVDEPPASE